MSYRYQGGRVARYIRSGTVRRTVRHREYGKGARVMMERGHLFRRAFSWLPAQFASQSDAPVGAPRQFGSTEHLSIEAVAAYVDGELRMNAHLRAAHHLALCPQCAEEVRAQQQARAALRDSWPVNMPSSLFSSLSQIPHAPTTPPDDLPPPGSPEPLAEDRARDRRRRR